MEHLPLYIRLVFILTTLLTLFFFYKATHSKPLLILWIAWLALQTALGLSGFYTHAGGVPPRFILLLLPPILIIIAAFFTKKSRARLDRFDIKTLTLLHIVRIPVELTLYWLFLYKAIPQAMTFEGRNFDILCGLTAPFIYYFGFIKHSLNKAVLIGWNVVCLLLLANIVSTVVLSVPFQFQQPGEPNFALFYFPFVWLPCCIVPLALFSHLVTLRQLITTTNNKNER